MIMSSYDIYIFFLCFIVFAMLTGLFATMLVIMVKHYLKLVKHGIEDENIKIEYEKEKENEKKPGNKVIGCIFSVITFGITAAVFVVFIFSAVVGARTTHMAGEIPALKVVASDSMSYKHPHNTYLVQHGLNNQINTFDLVLLHQLPEEGALKQYDVVAYERNGNLILHRIVNIEEPDAEHPDKRYFLLQGDAVEFHDTFPVLYSDMRGIYQGERFPFIGSFFMFMQSPAGYLCILLILFAMVATPIVERKIKAEKQKRYDLICGAA